MTDFVSLYNWFTENRKNGLLSNGIIKRTTPLTPKDISFGSTKKVAWVYEYINEIDGSKFVFKWTNSPNRRTITAKRNDNVCLLLLGTDK